jgi:hypothetical protein
MMASDLLAAGENKGAAPAEPIQRAAPPTASKEASFTSNIWDFIGYYFRYTH